MKILLTAFSAFSMLFALNSCGSDEILIPKPPTYLRHDFPKHEYKKVVDNCPYTFEISKAYSYKTAGNQATSCHKDIELGPLNGTMNLSYINMDRPLKDYIDYALSKVEEHQVKADKISDEQFIRQKDRVFGTFFELKGNVASPFQFYITDSTDRFVSGMVYFNSRPNYDSLKPSLEYLKTDLKHFIETFEWK